MDYNESLKRVSDYVTSFYAKQTQAGIVYHNYKHTWELTDAVNRIASGYALDDRGRFIVLTAAWFYDTGYYIAGTDSHKSKSSTFAAEFLQTISVDEVDINSVKDCINATQLPQQPKNLHEEIVCDAVMYYLGIDNYPEKSKLLRKETEALNSITISGSEWRERSISLMELHHYFTDYCRQNLGPTKMENLHKLKKKQETKAISRNTTSAAVLPGAVIPMIPNETSATLKNEIVSGKTEEEKRAKKEKKERKKRKKPVRGVETVFRISATNHQRLSAMADNKAHIMISVNSIIISVLLGLIVQKMDKYHDILIPTILMLATNLTAIIFSILATRPRIPAGYFTKEQVTNKEVDLTFFGNFYKMDFPDYESGMRSLMVDSDFAYGSLIRNVYGQGKVLGKKFTYLRASYNVFMIGMTISVLVFVIVLSYFNK